MATPSQDDDDDATGSDTMTATEARLIQLLVFHTDAVAALRRTLDLLNGDATIPPPLPPRAPRQTQRVLTPRTTSHLSKTSLTIRRQRLRTAKILERLERVTVPLTSAQVGAGRMIGGLIRHGYVTKTPKGYRRTAKPYAVDPWTGGA